MHIIVLYSSIHLYIWHRVEILNNEILQPILKRLSWRWVIQNHNFCLRDAGKLDSWVKPTTGLSLHRYDLTLIFLASSIFSDMFCDQHNFLLSEYAPNDSLSEVSTSLLLLCASWDVLCPPSAFTDIRMRISTFSAVQLTSMN